MPQESHAISVTLNGRRIEGQYAVNAGMLTVWSPVLGSRSIQLTGQAPAAASVSLLRELCEDFRRQHGWLPFLPDDTTGRGH